MRRFPQSLLLAGLAAALVLSVGACDITKLNDNPNEASTVTTSNLLTGALVGGGNPADLLSEGLASIYWDDYPGAFWVRYAQYWTTNQYTDADRWLFPTRRGGSNDENWEDFYLVLNDLQEIIRVSRRTPQAVAASGPPENQIAIAKIMQAFTFQMMTDMWGPIPFTEALKGRSQDNFTPSYTSQPDIYRGLIDSLTAASEMIIEDETTLASGDVVFGGDMSKWKKLANSLKMRVAIRAADQIPEVASTAINEALAAGVMESNADNAAIPFSASSPYQNPFYENYEVDGRDDWAAPEPILGLMNEVEDPRRASYFTDGNPDKPGNQFNPFPYGLPGGEAQALFTSPGRFFSRPSTRVRGDASAPAFIMLYDEVLFIQAEAAQRGFIEGDANQLYQDAIRASMEYWDAGGDVDSYLERVPYDNSNGWAPEGGAGETWESTLGIQKWLALYLQGMQGWAEWRRLDFQEVLQVPSGNPGVASFGCDFPLRMEYPGIETAVNEESRQTALEDYLEGEDTQGIALWWDVQTPGCD